MLCPVARGQRNKITMLVQNHIWKCFAVHCQWKMGYGASGMTKIFLLLYFTCLFQSTIGQEPVIRIKQGSVRGTRLFTERRVPVFGFLGIPYAKSPTGQLRFKPSEPHPGWDHTLNAAQFGPVCPQPDATGVRMAENCLTLNIWIPNIPTNFRRHPVLVFIDGEMFTTGNPQRFPGEDLAAEGLVIVTLNYRMNVFGFLSLEDPVIPGNLGLLDQYMALLWIQENIDKFGGDKNKVTLMGHSAGAASVSYHLLSRRTNGKFHSAILMSGNALAPWARSHRPRVAGIRLARRLGCFSYSSRDLLNCLRGKDMNEILRVFQEFTRTGNTSAIFSPVVDSFLPTNQQYLSRDPLTILEYGDFRKVPVITGVTLDEGIGMMYYLQDPPRQSYQQLRFFMETMAIPTIMWQYNYHQHRDVITQILKFSYLERAAQGDRLSMLEQLIELYGDAYFKAPNNKFVSLLVQAGNPTYMYSFDHSGPDIYGNSINFTGAAHGSDLLYLFGPRMYRDVLGRGFSFQDEQLSQNMKRMWLDFSEASDPTPRPFGTKWRRYSKENKYFFMLKDQVLGRGYDIYRMKFWNGLLPKINELGSTEENPTTAWPTSSQGPLVTLADPTQPYQNIMWVLIALLLLLLIALALSVFCFRRRSKSAATSFNIR